MIVGGEFREPTPEFEAWWTNEFVWYESHFEAWAEVRPPASRPAVVTPQASHPRNRRRRSPKPGSGVSDDDPSSADSSVPHRAKTPADPKQVFRTSVQADGCAYPTGSLEERIYLVVREAVESVKGEVLAAVSATLRVEQAAPQREWLTTTQVAGVLEVTPATVCVWVKTGRLRAAPGTRYLRIHRDELARFMSGAGGTDHEKIESLVGRLRKTR